MAKNIYSLSATLLRQKAYTEGRKAAAENKLTCPYNDRFSRDVWLQGYENFTLERNMLVEDYQTFA